MARSSSGEDASWDTERYEKVAGMVSNTNVSYTLDPVSQRDTLPKVVKNNRTNIPRDVFCFWLSYQEGSCNKCGNPR